MKRLHVTAWRDGIWLEERRPERFEIRRRSFAERIRALPRGTHNQLAYVGWITFLFAFYTARHLLIYFMITGVFASTRGLDLDLSHVYLSPADVARIEKENEYVLERIEIRRGALTAHTDSGLPLGSFVGARCPIPDRRPLILGFEVQPEATYQDLLNVLEAVPLLSGPECALRFAIISPRSTLNLRETPGVGEGWP